MTELLLMIGVLPLWTSQKGGLPLLITRILKFSKYDIKNRYSRFFLGKIGGKYEC